jgi:hypothetical protein
MRKGFAHLGKPFLKGSRLTTGDLRLMSLLGRSGRMGVMVSFHEWRFQAIAVSSAKNGSLNIARYSCGSD